MYAGTHTNMRFGNITEMIQKKLSASKTKERDRAERSFRFY